MDEKTTMKRLKSADYDAGDDEVRKKKKKKG